ncbi:MAG: hypothetical protein NVS3B10_22820 [Polyangiales bacterium]
MRLSGSALVVLCLACAAAGCSGKVSVADVDAGFDGGDGGGADGASDGAGDVAPDSTGSPEACAACVDATCKETWDGCVADAACYAQIDCVAHCRTDACEADCVAAHPSPLAEAAKACFKGPCRAACTAPRS